jgi:hypothetical protein
MPAFYLFSDHTILCECAEDLPTILLFDNLHITDSLRDAKATLKGESGIYCLYNTNTGAMYIGSSINLGDRLIDHIFNHGSNIFTARNCPVRFALFCL